MTEAPKRVKASLRDILPSSEPQYPRAERPTRDTGADATYP